VQAKDARRIGPGLRGLPRISLLKLSEKPHERANLLAIRRLIAT
jgi:hypothetical protein